MKPPLLVLALIVLGFQPATPDVAVTLQSLTDAERAFAAAARVMGVRDAFLEYFADDAIALVPEATPAKPRLLSRPAQPVSVFELTWEPRAGDVARSGDFGWLTGPSRSVNHQASAPAAQYGSYLSIWRRQAGSPWRVRLDIGVNTPGPAAFDPGFSHLQLGSRFEGKADAALATRELLDADRRLNGEAGAAGTAAYTTVLARNARLHRHGEPLRSGREAIIEAVKEQARVQGATGGGETAASADLGYTHGTWRTTDQDKAAVRADLGARCQREVVVDARSIGRVSARGGCVPASASTACTRPGRGAPIWRMGAPRCDNARLAGSRK